MKILIHTIGTRGDVQPYVALGRGLVVAGHEVTICTCQKFESFITANGLNYAYVNNELMDFLHTDDAKIAMERTGTLYESLRTGIRLFPKVRPLLTRQIADAWASTQEASPDLILFHPKSITGIDFAEQLGIPCMLAFYLPIFVPTAEAPAMGLPKLPLGGAYNRWTYRAIEWAAWWGTGKLVNAWRDSVGLPRRRGIPYLQSSAGQPIPSLHAFSESVSPRPSDWPAQATVCGYWFLDQEEAWEPAPQLADFLASGEPPVYFGFGSIFGRDPARHVRTVIESCERAGVRGVIARGWGGLDAQEIELPPTVIAIDHAPHDWLFPRVATVVHHGGCGTTAAGLRAGRPSILCPFFGDQPFWGDRVAQIGVGPKPIPQGRLTTARLSAAIKETLENAEMREKAAEIGRHIQAENGVARAVEFIEKRLTGPGFAPPSSH